MDVAARLEVVERENDELRERIAQLEGLLGFRTTTPIEFGLTGCEARVFGALLAREIATKSAIFAAVYANRSECDQAEPKIVDVFVCKMRRKLKPFGVDIKTAWGTGYYLDNETKKRVRAMMPAAAAA